MSEVEVYKRMLERERKARQLAESLLETKSLELYQAHHSSQKAAEELETIFQSVSDGILTFCEDGKIEKINPAVSRIFGYDDAQLFGMHVRELVPEGDTRQAMIDSSYWVELCTPDQPKVSTHGLKANGESFDMELSASRAEREGSVVYIWVLRNTQRLKNLERRMMVSQRLEGIGQLAAGISHEINTPIQYVFENSKFLRDAFASMEAVLTEYEHLVEKARDRLPRELVSEVSRVCQEREASFFRDEVPNAIEETISGSKRVASIVRSIKEFAHPGTSEKTVFDLNRAVHSAITVSSNHWKHVADIETHLDDDLQPISCYAADINQVLLNLIVNASDAISERKGEDGARGTITVRSWTEGDTAKLSVSDTGIGIARQNLDRIFTPFFTTKSIGKGTGQGLALVHSVIVERHNGHIEVDSEVGAGTTFVLTIPTGD